TVSRSSGSTSGDVTVSSVSVGAAALAAAFFGAGFFGAAFFAAAFFAGAFFAADFGAVVVPLAAFFEVDELFFGALLVAAAFDAARFAGALPSFSATALTPEDPPRAAGTARRLERSPALSAAGSCESEDFWEGEDTDDLSAA